MKITKENLKVVLKELKIGESQGWDYFFGRRESCCPGELLCGAKSEATEGDTYIDDRLQYELAVVQKVIVPDINEAENGKHYWLKDTFPVFESKKYK